MLETDREAGTARPGQSAPGPDPVAVGADASAAGAGSDEVADASADARDREDSLIDELGTLIDDAGLYASAEIAFQKTRAKLAMRLVGVAAGAVLLAVILLHIALIALAVGFVIALEPLVTIWGAIAIVVGVMLAGVVALALMAASKARLLGKLFASNPAEEAAQSAKSEGASQ